MQTNIIKIGNSYGTILPKSILKALNLSTKTPMQIYMENGNIVLSPLHRNGWNKKFKDYAMNGEDTLELEEKNDYLEAEWIW